MSKDTEKDWFDEGYEMEEEISPFMKLQDGDNNIRIVSKPVVGYEYWNENNKPVRSKTKWDKTPGDIKIKDGKPTPIKHFWSFLVYNYDIGAVQSLEITQATIQRALADLVNNSKWGNPMKYDITINRTGKELQTKYSVIPSPHSEMSEEIKQAVEESNIDLEEVFGENDK